MGLGKLAALLLCVTPLAAHEGGDCDAFTWDVSRGLAAMRAKPKPLTVSSELRVNLIDGATAIGSRDHQGRSTCKLLHKVVEFELPAQRELTTQLSGDDAATVGIVVTAVEPS
jgi:hypothetical protein